MTDGKEVVNEENNLLEIDLDPETKELIREFMKKYSPLGVEINFYNDNVCTQLGKLIEEFVLEDLPLHPYHYDPQCSLEFEPIISVFKDACAELELLSDGFNHFDYSNDANIAECIKVIKEHDKVPDFSLITFVAHLGELSGRLLCRDSRYD